MPQVKYTQITIECSGCPASVLNCASDIKAVLRSAALACNLHVLKEDLHQFNPQGITGYVLLSESHISIHTWPEEQFAIIDILSCSSINVEKVTACLRKYLLPSTINLSSHSRKIPGKNRQKENHKVRNPSASQVKLA
jgi:S-adenosylmethionine decarboxylase